MWTEVEIKAYVKNAIDEKRYNHTLGVVKTAEELAILYGESTEKAKLAALIHDAAKNIHKDKLINLIINEGYDIDSVERSSSELLHGIGGAIVAKKEMGIEDSDILNAIRWHTTGRPNMSKLEKIIYLADYIEPNRIFDGVEELRELCKVDLDKAMIKALDNTIKYVITKKSLIHIKTIEARNYLLLK